MKREPSKRDFFERLDWDDLEQWVGSRILSRGQGYQRSHRVKELAQAPTGSLVAWVHGGQRYATEVDFEDGELISICTCPYGNNCKHAVAVVLEYLDHLSATGFSFSRSVTYSQADSPSSSRMAHLFDTSFCSLRNIVSISINAER